MVVCRQCRYGVWPSQIERHLQRAHRHIAPRIREQLGEEVRSWPDIMVDPGQLDIPASIPQSIDALGAPLEGWQCRLKPTQFQYVCRTTATMQKHWRNMHQWCRTQQRGQPRRMKRITIQQRQEHACRPILCQRLFTQEEGSRYFAIIGEDDDDPETPDRDPCQQFIRHANHTRFPRNPNIF